MTSLGEWSTPDFHRPPFCIAAMAAKSSTEKTTILIYGAYGYTGALCCEEAARKELDFIVGGVSGN